MAPLFDPILQAIDFIEANLQETITVGDMADAVRYSLYHFCRTFNAITHHTPYDYLMRRRLSESARVLLHSEQRIIDISLDYDFNNPETYTRAFKRLFHMPPTRWKQRQYLDQRAMMPRLTRAHLEHRQHSLRPVVDSRPALHIAGISTLVQSDAPSVDLWALLSRLLSDVPNLPDAPHFVAVSTYPQGWEQDGFLYMAGILFSQAPSPMLSSRFLPPMTYARFDHRGTRTTLPLTQDYVYATWLPKSGKRLSHRFEIQDYGQRARPPRPDHNDCSLLVPII